MIVLQYLLMIVTFFAAAIRIRLLPDDYYTTKENKTVFGKHGFSFSYLFSSFTFTSKGWIEFRTNSFILFLISGLLFLLLCVLNILQIDFGLSIFHAFIGLITVDFIAMTTILRLCEKKRSRT